MQIDRRRAQGLCSASTATTGRTQIIEDSGELSIEDLIAEEDMAITVSNIRLHQADADHQLSQPAPRRQGAASACAPAKKISCSHLFVASTTPTS
jgi:DNA gyrase/topoisomerase IV subunit A